MKSLYRFGQDWTYNCKIIIIFLTFVFIWIYKLFILKCYKVLCKEASTRHVMVRLRKKLRERYDLNQKYCYWVVHKHGYSIWCFSRVSTFFLKSNISFKVSYNSSIVLFWVIVFDIGKNILFFSLVILWYGYKIKFSQNSF